MSSNRKIFFDIQPAIIFITTFAVISTLFFSCSDSDKKINLKQSLSGTWYKQANVDLGYRIKMLSVDSGYAVSRGRGNIPGCLYKFNNGRWDKIFQYPYSDFPQLAVNNSTLWLINHLVHSGQYKPVLTSISDDKPIELNLPTVMWDATDYSMWKTIQVMNNGTVWMAGQQGNIIYYDGRKWKNINSPVVKDTLPTLLSGDINDMFMISDSLGWAVGKDGLIIKYENGEWKKFNSPTVNHLNKILMLNENGGWIAGQKGTLLFYDGNSWNIKLSGTPNNLNSVKSDNNGNVAVAGDNSTLLIYDGKTWHQDETVKYLDDDFLDIELTSGRQSFASIWLIGGRGIYTNHKSIGFSFTDFTDQSSLRRQGKGGIFFNTSRDDQQAVYIMNEDCPSLLFENDGRGIFSEKKLTAENVELLQDNSSTAIGDINNDGYNDLLQLHYANYFKIFTGSASGFSDFTNQSGLDFSEIEPQSIISSHFADFDNDGSLDLLISNDEKELMIFKNNGAGRFIRIAGTGIPHKKNIKSFGATLSDFNNDGLIDIFLPYQTQKNYQHYSLFINKNNFRFEEVVDSTFYISSSFSPSTTVSISEDFNNDGLMDILIHNQKSPPVMLLNKGNLKFVDASDECGFREIVFHPEPINGILNASDVNNDGWTDVFISSKLYLNSSGCRFTDVSEQTGINFTGNPAFCDIDNDGDNDLLIGSSAGALGKGERAILYRNNLNNKNFLKVFLEGDKSNRSAFGAELILTAYDSTGNEVYKTKKIYGLGASPMLQQEISYAHFGLNPALKHKLTIIFPSGIKKEIDEIIPGQSIKINESGFAARNYFRLDKSISRTMLLIDFKTLLIKLILFLILLLLLSGIGNRAGVKHFIRGKIFYPLLVIVFLLLVHFTVMLDVQSQYIYTFAFTSFAGLILIFAAREKQKRIRTNLISHFRIINQIGSGGMGKVFRAIDINNKKEVALKIINPEILKDPENKKRFALEGSLLSSFNHENIVKVYESAEAGESSFIAMELLEGGSLKEFINRNFPLDTMQITDISRQICSGLSEMHKNNIIHRDIKTNNIMFDSSGKIRIMDFGLSKSNLVSTMTTLGTVVGTLGYVAPEQVTSTNVDERADIYSLGVVMYELAAGTLPFKGENEIALIHSIFNTYPETPSSINKKILPGLDKIILKCINKIPAERYSSVDEVIEDILQL